MYQTNNNFTDLIGIPFKDRGRDLNGLDCWGLAKIVFKRYGQDIPDYNICCEDITNIDKTIDKQRSYWKKIEKPVAPCLVVMHLGTKFCNHTGVYIGNGRFIHTRDKVGVNIDRIDSINWKNRIEGFYLPPKKVKT